MFDIAVGGIQADRGSWRAAQSGSREVLACAADVPRVPPPQQTHSLAASGLGKACRTCSGGRAGGRAVSACLVEHTAVPQPPPLTAALNRCPRLPLHYAPPPPPSRLGQERCVVAAPLVRLHHVCHVDGALGVAGGKLLGRAAVDGERQSVGERRSSGDGDQGRCAALPAQSGMPAQPYGCSPGIAGSRWGAREAGGRLRSPRLGPPLLPQPSSGRRGWRCHAPHVQHREPLLLIEQTASRLRVHALVAPRLRHDGCGGDDGDLQSNRPTP